MEQLVGRWGVTEAIGADLGTNPQHAAQRVDRAKEALDVVDLSDASAEDVKLADRAHTRLDGLSDLLEMARRWPQLRPPDT